MRRGFTLLELQASLFVGTVVVMLAGSLLLGEHARQIRLEQQASLRMFAARVDASLQWAFFQAESVELSAHRLVVHARDGVWSLAQNGISRDFAPLIEGVRLISARLEGTRLTLDLSLSAGGLSERVSWQYHLGQGVVSP